MTHVADTAIGATPPTSLPALLDLSNVRLGSNGRQRRCERPSGREARSVGRSDRPQRRWRSRRRATHAAAAKPLTGANRRQPQARPHGRFQHGPFSVNAVRDVSSKLRVGVTRRTRCAPRWQSGSLTVATPDPCGPAPE